MPVLQPPAQQNRVFRFGEFEYSVRAIELRRNGELVRLQQQPLRVLLALLEFPEEVVTRDELRERVWPGDSVQDFDNSLRVAINKLRQALGDDTEGPQFIETLPRRGYRWIYPVTVVDTTPNGIKPEYRLVEERVDRQLGFNNISDVVGPKAGWARKIGVTVLLLFTAIAAGRFLRRPAEYPEPKLVPLTTYPGLEYMPSISPDGKRVAFAWTGPTITGSYAVYVKTIGDDSARRLTEAPAGASDGDPVWSADGQSVYFFRRGGPQPGIYVAAWDGGSARLVVPTAMSGRRLRRSRFDVSSDGRTLVYPDVVEGQETAALYLFDLATQQRRQITHPPASSEGDGDPAFSHDTKSIAFQRNTLDFQQLYIWSDAHGERRVVSDNFLGDFIDGLAWTVDDQEIVFGGQELRRVKVTGGQPTITRISYASSPATFPALRGNSLAFVQATVNANIWKLDLKDPVHVAGQPTQLIASTRQQAAPSFSPDGSSIAFQSDRSGTWEIWVCNRDGSEAVQLTHMGGSLTGTPRWSPDSRQIAFDSRASGVSQIYVVPAHGGKPRQLTNDDAGGEVPSWSRDGKWIYYSSVRHGEARVWKAPAEGGEPRPVTTGTGIYAAESFDGKWLYFSRDPHDPVIWRVPVQGGTEEPVAGVPKPFDTSHWALAPSGIYVIDASGDLWFFEFGGRTTTRIYREARFLTDWSMAVSNDGRQVIWAEIDERAADLMLIQNFH